MVVNNWDATVSKIRVDDDTCTLMAHVGHQPISLGNFITQIHIEGGTGGDEEDGEEIYEPVSRP